MTTNRYKTLSLLLILFLFNLFFVSVNSSYAKKSKEQMEYERRERIINNRDDLTSSDKVEKRIDAHEDIFGEPDSGGCAGLCLFLIGIVVLVIIVSYNDAKNKIGKGLTPLKNHSNDNSFSVSDTYLEDTKLCPYCAEKIKREAIKCKHCGSDLSGENEN